MQKIKVLQELECILSGRWVVPLNNLDSDGNCLFFPWNFNVRYTRLKDKISASWKGVGLHHCEAKVQGRYFTDSYISILMLNFLWRSLGANRSLLLQPITQQVSRYFASGIILVVSLKIFTLSNMFQTEAEGVSLNLYFQSCIAFLGREPDIRKLAVQFWCNAKSGLWFVDTNKNWMR
jgi:hypothetical protein